MGSTMDLSIDKKAITVARATKVPLITKQKVQKAKEVSPAKSKGKEKEKAPSQATSKRKTMESSVEGAPKKKLLASACRPNRVEIRPSLSP